MGALESCGGEASLGRQTCCDISKGPAAPLLSLLESRRDIKRDAVIIFDWDDTLMCSSQIRMRCKFQRQELLQLGMAVENVLATAMALGSTSIVTNAHLAWVQETAKLFIPSAVPILQNVEIMSARQIYEGRWPGNVIEWKRQAFLDILVGRRHQKVSEAHCHSGDGGHVVYEKSHKAQGQSMALNFVVIGDSMAEMQAAQVAFLAHGEEDALVKTVKFKELPTAKELTGQLWAVANELEMVVAEGRSGSKKLVLGSGLSGWKVREAGFLFSL